MSFHFDPVLLQNQPGIYQIRNSINGNVYIGSSKNIRSRVTKHFRELRLGKHHSRHLQFAFNKYGEKCFVPSVVQIVEDVAWLLFNEQAYIDGMDKKTVIYNVCMTAGNCAGVKQSEETKEKRAKKLRGLKRDKSVGIAISRAKKGACSESVRKAIAASSEKRSFKLDQESVEKVSQLRSQQKTWVEIAKEFGCVSVKPLRREVKRLRPDLVGKRNTAKTSREYFSGERHAMANLSEMDVRRIVLGGESISDLADKFGMNRSHISDIRHGRSWKSIYKKIISE